MKCFQIFILTAIQLQISIVNLDQILYVLPNNSSNVSCTFQPCATLGQYLLDDGKLAVVSNDKYHYLPGEHRVPVNMVLQNLHNFSIVGTKMYCLAVHNHMSLILLIQLMLPLQM